MALLITVIAALQSTMGAVEPDCSASTAATIGENDASSGSNQNFLRTF